MPLKKRQKTRKTKPGPEDGVQRIDLKMSELEAILDRAASAPLSDEDRDTLLAAIETLDYLTRELGKKRVSIQRLKAMLFGATTEKTRQILAAVLARTDADKADEPGAETGPTEKRKRKGHGRNGADAYTGAEKVTVSHQSLTPGDSCPKCTKGKVYQTAEPGRLVRIRGRAPLSATVYELQKLRCNLCGTVFTAQVPNGVGEEKYDAESASMIGLLKYGSGLPFNRLQRLQGSLGIPLPASTQWEIVEQSSRAFEPVLEELIRQAAQGEVIHNDDTTMKILGLTGSEQGRPCGEGRDGPARSGVFTSGIISKVEGHEIALFFTGRKHAGENLAHVLQQRSRQLEPPIQMCDALSRNLPGELKTIVANCLAHGRRRFVDVAGSFPDECLHVLGILKAVYRNDAQAREEKMSPEERLRFHQAASGPRMDELEEWLAAQFEERKVEPNSGLGEAITYMRKHWEKLTLFLHEPGAPLDNNICERALKKAILHRKNAYFYKTDRGARVGDLFMSLIHTCELCRTNPFDYLTQLQKHRYQLFLCPGNWMPWNYRDTVNRINSRQQ